MFVKKFSGKLKSIFNVDKSEFVGIGKKICSKCHKEYIGEKCEYCENCKYEENSIEKGIIN